MNGRLTLGSSLVSVVAYSLEGFVAAIWPEKQLFLTLDGRVVCVCRNNTYNRFNSINVLSFLPLSSAAF